MTGSAYAQTIHYTYDPGANFATYKTYQWVDLEGSGGAVPDQSIDRMIRRAVDEQLAHKGLVKVDKDGDLRVGYEAVIDPGRKITFVGTESPAWSWGKAVVQGETSTISVGMVWVDLYDPSREQLVWRGDASKIVYHNYGTRNYKSLERAMVKLLTNYPPPPR